MSALPGINYLDAIRAFQRQGFILLQGTHVVMAGSDRKLTIPRSNPVNAIAMSGIVQDAGLTNEEFKKLL